MASSIRLEHSTERLTNVHAKGDCYGEYCVIHKRSKHAMRKFPQHWRSDSGIMERICTHGIGHPDPDEFELEVNLKGVHGCDGCCSGPFRFEAEVTNG